MTYMPPPYEHPLRRRRRLDRVARLIIVDWALGMGLGAVAALLMLAFDVLGLRTRLFDTDIVWVGGAAFVILFALAFGGVVAAAAAMRADDDDEPRGGLRARALAYAPVRVR
jgi:pimeloyl-ACP methyl ester carboxylesterase